MPAKTTYMGELLKGIWKDNPVLVLLLGLCPTLAVTNCAYNGLGMGAATTFVLVGSNIIISLIRSIVPRSVRIPIYIVVIATFVTVVEMLLKAFQYDLSRSLGLFVPLIVVNCIILGRAEAFASRNGILRSALDGLGMALGFTLALFVLGSIREIIGSVYDLRPAAIIEYLDLLRPIYAKTAAYGHFGRNEPAFTWERTSEVEAMRKAA